MHPPARRHRIFGGPQLRCRRTWRPPVHELIDFVPLRSNLTHILYDDHHTFICQQTNKIRIAFAHAPKPNAAGSIAGGSNGLPAMPQVSLPICRQQCAAPRSQRLRLSGTPPAPGAAGVGRGNGRSDASDRRSLKEPNFLTAKSHAHAVS